MQRHGDRIHRATGDNHIVRIRRSAGSRHALCDLAPQFLIAGRHDQLACVLWMITQHFANQIVEPPIRIQGGRGKGSMQLHDARLLKSFAASVQHLGRHRARLGRTAYPRTRFGNLLDAGRLHIETRLRPGFDQAGPFKMHVRLYDGRDTHAGSPAHGAH